MGLWQNETSLGERRWGSKCFLSSLTGCKTNKTGLPSHYWYWTFPLLTVLSNGWKGLAVFRRERDLAGIRDVSSEIWGRAGHPYSGVQMLSALLNFSLDRLTQISRGWSHDLTHASIKPPIIDRLHIHSTTLVHTWAHRVHMSIPRKFHVDL